jgi:(5-formylfuran-3-yl)methyl phosphate synthase
MPPLIDRKNRPGLLVSVRDAREALAALEGGAHVIDVKEPRRGSLGAAEASAIEAVVRAVAGRVPVTAAAGELMDLVRTPPPKMPDGVSLFKIGVAGCRVLPHWQVRWREAMAALWPKPNAPAQAAAVVYADWRTAAAPLPEEVLHAATEFGCPALLVDTWSKSSGTLFDHWPIGELQAFVDEVRSRGMHIVLAGSLVGECLAAASQLKPDLVAVRTAVCEAGRAGPISCQRVAAVREAISAAPSIAT